MRKTNKNFKKIASDKSGVVLITVIFIVAMALIFITTAMTISIATRRRVYSNAKYQQARLTAVSLAQSIWQAIYSQQISDEMLVELAKGTGGQGSLVSFTNNDVPGMGLGGTQATAYFYCVTPGNPSKIGIECKCDIDGASSDGSTQYYTIILERGKGEDFPPAAWRLPFRIGGGGDLSSCNIGVNASLIQGAERMNQVRYNADDNIAFIHGGSTTAVDGCGFYCRLLTDTSVPAHDSIFAWDSYFIGPNASLDFTASAQNERPSRNLNGSNAGGNSNQRGDMYFWGTENPFTRSGHINGDTSSAGGLELRNINNLYFDNNPTVANSFRNFNQTRFTSQFFSNNPAGVNVHYEEGIGFTFSGTMPGNWQSHTSGWDSDASTFAANMNGDASEMDTIDEVISQYGSHIDGSETMTNIVSGDGISRTSLNGGTYVIDHTVYLNHNLTCNVDTGNIYIYVTGGADLNIGNSSWGQAFIKITGTAENNNVVFLLDSGSRIRIGNTQSGQRGNCGIVDTRVFSNTSYTDPHGLIQTTTPRCQVLALYEGGYPVRYEANGQMVLTAMLGFFPQSNPDGSTGGQLYVSDAHESTVYYGRINTGGVFKASGNFFNVPYCPPVPSAGVVRDYAYRDNTDYQIVETTAGTSGFFTVMP